MAQQPPNRPVLFDEALIAARRDRSERLGFAGGADFLHREVAGLIAERLAEVTRPFADAAIIGSGGGVHAGALQGRVAGDAILQVELSPQRAARAGANGSQRLTPCRSASVASIFVCRCWNCTGPMTRSVN